MNAGATRSWEAWTDPNEALPKPSLFNPRVSFRKLVVLLDQDALNTFTASQSQKAYLLNFLLNQPQVHWLRYADDGPPPNVTPDEVAPTGTKFYDDWVTPIRNGDVLTSVVHRRPPNGRALTGVGGNFPISAEQDRTSTAYADTPAAEAANLRRRAVEAIRVADEIQSDILVTDRPYLFEKGRRFAQLATPMKPEEAIAFTSLYLRTQNRYLTDGGGHSLPVAMSRDRFLWVGTRELLPASWRWFSACLQHSNAMSDDDFLYLAQSALQRVQRVLNLRDRVHTHINRPQNQDVAEDVLESLDGTLLALMGVADALARVAHRALDFTTKVDFAGWQRPWFDQVKKIAPDLAKLCLPGTGGYDALTILRLLRNSVHGEAIQAQGLRTPQHNGTIIVLPSRDTVAVDAAMNRLGGSAAWGVRQILNDRIQIEDPGALLENLVTRMLTLLDALMTETPVEQLPHVVPNSQDHIPPTEYPWEQSTRLSIRWQLGF